MAEAPKPPQTPQTIKVLEIVSRPDNFWRAGRQWTKEPQQVPVDDFTDAQIKALKADKNLVVLEKTIEVKAEA